MKVDVIGPENILFAGMSLHLQPRNFTCWGSEGVKVFVCMSECPSVYMCWCVWANVLVFTCVCVHRPMSLCLHLLVCMGECPCVYICWCAYVWMSLCLHVLVCICVNVLVFSVYMCWHAWVNVLVFTFVGVHMWMSLYSQVLACIGEYPCVYICWCAYVWMSLCLHMYVLVFTFVSMHGWMSLYCWCVYAICVNVLVFIHVGAHA